MSSRKICPRARQFCDHSPPLANNVAKGGNCVLVVTIPHDGIARKSELEKRGAGWSDSMSDIAIALRCRHLEGY